MSFYGLIGEKLGHSFSPQIHQMIFEELGIQGEYHLIEVKPENLAEEIFSLKEKGYKGLNVTLPYKTAVLPLLDEISPEAKAIGAVNVIDFKDDKLIGYNSDYFGFSSMLQLAGINIKGKRVVQLGAGGAAKACTAVLHDLGAASVLVANRTGKNAEALKEQFPYITTCLLEDTAALEGDVLVNCTPVGMYPETDACPVSREVIAGFSAAADIIYNPPVTPLIRTAKELGLKGCGGLNMLVYQGIKAQEIWQNTTLPTELGKRIYNHLASGF